MSRPRMIQLPEVGTVYGEWTVLEVIEAPKHQKILCRCSCGVERPILYTNLYGGISKQCGHGRSPMLSRRNYRHGDTGTKLHRVWTSMKNRCSAGAGRSSRDVYYSRGIRVCDEWTKNFYIFRDWSLANGFAEGLVIDRINVDGNYEPSNCRWVTRKANARNTRRNHMVSAFGETKCIAAWTEDSRCSISQKLLSVRLNLGMLPERAISTPNKWLSPKTNFNKNFN